MRRAPEASRIDLTSLDDSQNMVAGMTYEDRMVLAYALNDILDGVAKGSHPDPQLSDDYLHFVAIAVLFKLIDQSGARWGSGSLGAGLPPGWQPGSTEADVRMARSRPSQQLARRPDRLLLNMVDPADVLPQFRDLNYPLELRRLKDRDHKRVFDKGVFIESTRLTIEIALHQTRLANLDVSREDEARIRALAREQKPIPLPGLQRPLNHMTVAHLLDYYGLGSPARTKQCRGHFVKPWRVGLLVSQYRAGAIIELANLTWMRGRYFYNGHPIETVRSPSGTP